MNNKMKNIFWIVAVMLTAVACYPEQEVSPVIDPTGYPEATIVARSTNKTELVEGDTLWFDITVTGAVSHDVELGIEFLDSSVGDDHDIEIVAGTGVLSAYATSTTIGVIIAEDGEAEPKEGLQFEISFKGDSYWNWQLSPNSDVLNASVSILDYEYTLSWSEATYVYSGDGNAYDMCDWGVDFDIYVANADFSEADWGAATGSCPEHSSFSGLPADTYDIYVDFYDRGDLPADAVLEIPYVVELGSLGSTKNVYEGIYENSDEGASTVIGQVVISEDGTYTVSFE